MDVTIAETNLRKSQKCVQMEDNDPHKMEAEFLLEQNNYKKPWLDW